MPKRRKLKNKLRIIKKKGLLGYMENSKKQAKRAGKGKRKRKFWRKALKAALIVGVILFFLGSVAFVGAFIYFSRDLPSPDKINARTVAQSTKIYDRTGTVLLYEAFGDEKRTMLSIDKMGDNVKYASIAAEDKTFYSHPGFSVRGIVRAFWKAIRGQRMEGGSTITQQFIKNSILTSERTVTRKVKELILAIEMERKFSKDEILQMYLNEIAYGSNAYGIEAAAETFFGKHAKDLTVSEAALLAALPNRPTYLSPYGVHTDDLKRRQDWIIDTMKELGHVSQEEAEKAKQEEWNIQPYQENIRAPHFVMYVLEYLADKYGEKEVRESGFTVITTIDLTKQNLAESLVKKYVKINRTKYRANNAALVAIDPKTGQILTMVGSYDYFDRKNDGNVNVATRLRQPGSSFKPIAYAKAFEKGFTPNTLLYDLNTDFGGGYKPKNYDKSQHGPVTMRQSLAMSLNINAVKTLYLAGIDDTIELSQKMGITTLEKGKFGLALVLGGGEVKLLDETAAFSVFANDGLKQKKTPILKITDSNGKVIEEFKQGKREQVLGKEVARNINSILSDNEARSPVFGSKSSLYLGSRPAAVKTGTTQEYRDGWTVGYTPSLACGVWAGNNDNSKMRNAPGIYVAAPLWNAFMTKTLKGTKIEKFPAPKKITTKKTVLNGKRAGETARICKASNKLATNDCPASYIENRTYSSVHCILYYVNKDDPQGAYPKNPSQDEQFKRWEGPVQIWAKRKGIIQSKPPTDYCDVHGENADKPSVSITSPGSGDTIITSSFTISVSASSSYGIKKVEFFVDGASQGSDTTSPYSKTVSVSSSGSCDIRVVAYDVYGNHNETSLSVIVDILGLSIQITKPASSTTIGTGSFPYAVSAEVSGDLSKVDKVVFYYQSIATSTTSTIGNGSKAGSTFSISWINPGAGKYRVFAILVATGEGTITSSKVTVTVS